MNGSIIDLQNVSVHLGGRFVLNKVCWQVNPGEHWAVLGRNGSGKTTLLNVLNGLLWPYGGIGTVAVFGQRYGTCDLVEIRKLIGWVSASLHETVYRHMIVRDIVMSGKFGSMAFRDQVTDADRVRAGDLLEQLDCQTLADRAYGELSEGEQKRVLLARAFMAAPRLLLLDEPCTGLDFVAREKLLFGLERLMEQSDAPTLIYVTHYPGEILPPFNRVLLLDGGEVVSEGDKASVLSPERLGQAFGVGLDVHWTGGRPNIILQRPSVV